MFEISYDPGELEGMSLEQVAERFQRFSRDEMAKGTLDVWGEQIFTDGKIRKAVHQLITNTPNGLLKLIRRATGDPSIRPQTIKDSLGRVLLPLLSSHAQTSGKGDTTKEFRRKQAALESRTSRRDKKDSGYTEDLHTKGKPREVLELYQRLDQFCLGLKPGAVDKQYLAKYIAYREGKRTFCCLHLFRGGLKVWLKLKFKGIASPPQFARDVSAIGHWGVGEVELGISNGQQLTEAEDLIKQSFGEM